jgi:hypothetical protein
MTTHIVKSTKDLRAIFPELPVTNKFKRSLDDVFKNGYEFKLDVQDIGYVFVSTSDRQYHARISYNGGTGKLLKRKRVINCSPTMAEYESKKEYYTEISDKPCGSHRLKDGEWTPMYAAKRITIEDTSWAAIGRNVGLLIKDEFINYQYCTKCGGSGFLPHYAHIDNGVCWQCMGIGRWLKVDHKI